MTVATADIIDLLAGIGPDDALSDVRANRQQARENAQRSFEALFEPEEAGSFTHAERYAVATFIALLHGFDAAAAFYGDLLSDEDAALVALVEAAATSAAAAGPYGEYREEGLASESRPGLRWEAPAELGERLSAAFTHVHLLVFRPREARPEALQALVDAGWSADEIVSLSQLVSFLAFQLRLAWGLRVLASTPASASPAPASTAAAPAEGA